MSTLMSAPLVDSERRHAPRLHLPAMYTLIRVRLAGDPHYRWTGHIYDVSINGMLFELNQTFPLGTQLEVRGMLPGQRQVTFHARGPLMRIHIESQSYGKTRMAMRFDTFARDSDRHNVADYLRGCGLTTQTTASPA